MANFTYSLTYGGVPFVGDKSDPVRLDFQHREGLDADQKAPRKYQPKSTLYDHLNEIIPFRWLSDFTPPTAYLGYNLSALAKPYTSETPSATVRIGEWFYPNGAARWSVFRGLATSSQVKAMVALALPSGAPAAQSFVMQAAPIGPSALGAASSYKITTSMYMLPPRSLAEIGGKFDGLYLVTLVDDRYYFQFKKATLASLTQDTTWANLTTIVTAALGISATPSVAAAYLQPEVDSQLWTNAENAAFLLDCIAWNIGTTVVRKFDGTYSFEARTTSQTTTNSNRGTVINNVVRTAGGNMFEGTGTNLPVGDLSNTKNAIVPTQVNVTFPIYVLPAAAGLGGGDSLNPASDQPVPHMFNTRYPPQRPSAWWEDSYGKTYTISIPIAQGGSTVSSLTGIGIHTIHDTAKAIFTTEAAATPANQTGLNTLATQLAQDYYFYQAASALDEVYPGTFAWTPEGLNDIVWTYSEHMRQASTRVMRAEWNLMVRDFQHSTPTSASNATNTPRGVGGKSVAQTIRDSFSGALSTTLGSSIQSGSANLTLTDQSYFPTQNRWRAQIGTEVLMLEGTSGGTQVDIVYRGIDGTAAANHGGGDTITAVLGNVQYGVNLSTYEKMEWVYPSEWTSGGIQGVRKVPQTQTVFCQAGSGTMAAGAGDINNIDHWSGRVATYDTSKSSGIQFPLQENIWIVERNGKNLNSGIRYDGQFVGYSKAFNTKSFPVYVVNEYSGSLGSGSIVKGMIGSGAVCSGKIASGSVNSGNYASGSVSNYALSSGCISSGMIVSGSVGSGALDSGSIVKGNIASGAVCSGKLGTASVNSGNIASGAIGQSALSSGAVQSGQLGNQIINNINFSSGAVQSGSVGNGAITSGNLASGMGANCTLYFCMSGGNSLTLTIINGLIQNCT